MQLEKSVEKLKPVYTLTLLLLAAMLYAGTVAIAQPEEYKYYARVDYVLTTSFSTSLLLSESKTRDIVAPPPPPGYKLYYIRAEFPGGLPSAAIPVKYDKVEVIDEKTTAVISYEGTISLAASSANVTVDARVTVCYIKSEWLELQEGDVTFIVEDPPPPFTPKDLLVRVSIDNHAPFAIIDVKDRNGESILGTESDPNMLKVDYKHVELNFTFLETGAYTITLKHGEEYVLPSSFLIIETEFQETTLKAGETRRFGTGQRQGWKALGAVVILYSITPMSGREGGDVVVQGGLVDYAYHRSEVASIKAASFLIPSINLKVWIEAYIVFGTWFEIRNRMKNTVNVLYTTIFMKETGSWSIDGVKVNIRESDVKDAIAAYLVVQAPSYARITGVKTPSGKEIGGIVEGLLPWGEEYREVRVFINEAYIQIKAFDRVEEGTYEFNIDWIPVEFRLVDDTGAPIIGAVVAVKGPINATAISDEEGVASFELYKPGPYKVKVIFKGVPVATLALGSIAEPVVPVKCDVYRVSWLVVDAWGRPLEGAEIVVKKGDTIIARVISGKDGTTDEVQVPGGDIVVQSVYKRITASSIESISGSGIRKLKVDVFLEIPLMGGLPLTTLETMITSIAAGGGIIGLAALRRGRQSTVEEISLER